MTHEYEYSFVIGSVPWPENSEPKTSCHFSNTETSPSRSCTMNTEAIIAPNARTVRKHKNTTEDTGRSFRCCRLLLILSCDGFRFCFCVNPTCHLLQPRLIGLTLSRFVNHMLLILIQLPDQCCNWVSAFMTLIFPAAYNAAPLI